jgi:type I site-specific restriction endonuclease
MNKKQLSERDICTKYITPALEKAGWDATTQVREEDPLTKGCIIVHGKLHTRAKLKRADYVLFYKPNIPIAIIEAKDNNHTVGGGMQQALGYADLLQVPFVPSSNGDGFLFHNKIASDGIIERELALREFPAAETLWQWWAQQCGLNDQQNALVTQEYFSDGSDKSPRCYQLLAINKTIEAIARGQNRILLVMATGTGKTFTAFQIIWRRWKSKAKKRIIFLADRNILVDQTMTKIQQRQANKSYEIYLSLYQAVTGDTEEGGGVRRYVVANVEVKVAAERVRYFDANGKLITESLKDYTRKALAREYAALDDLLRRWSSTEKKHVWDESNPTEKIRPKPHFCVEHIFRGTDGLEGWFRTDDKSGLIKFKGDKHKVRFAKEVVPILDPACFEVFRPMFDFIKSKCSAGAEGEEVA